MEEPEDTLVEVELVFSEIAFSVIPLEAKDVEAWNKPHERPFKNWVKVSLLMEFDDVEEFFDEVRLQFYQAHLAHC